MRKQNGLAFILAFVILLSGCGINIDSIVPENPDTTASGTAATSAPETDTGNTPAVVDAAQPNNTFGVGYVSEGIFDPMNTDYEMNSELSHLIYDSLFTVKDDGTVEKGICSECSSSDGINYTIKITDGLKFHNGQSLTVKDVAYSLDRARDSGLYSAKLKDITSVTYNTDTGTVNIILRAAVGSLPLLLDIPIIAKSPDIYEYSDYALLGSGRYYIDIEELEETEYTYLQFYREWRDYGNENPALARIDLFTVTDKEDMLRRYFNSDIDILDLSSSINETIVLHGEAEIREKEGNEFFYLGFNTNKNTFYSADTRKGVSQIINREELTANTWDQKLYPADYPVHSSSLSYQYLTGGPWFDAAKGKTSLRSAGLTSSGYTLVLLANSDSDLQVSTAEQLKNILNTAGVSVQLKLLNYNSYIQALYAGSYDIYIGETKLSDNCDLSSIISSGDLFASLYSRVTGTAQTPAAVRINPEVSAILADIKKLNYEDDNYAEQLGNKMNELLGYMPVVPLFFDSESVYIKGSFVSGIEITRNDIFYNIDKWISLKK